MELVTAPTKTDQVTAILRSGIMRGTYPTGSRLRSVRELAEEFGVSSRIITSALEFLEREKLIRREQGRGVFVEAMNRHDNLEVYMLLWGDVEGGNNYSDEISKLTSPNYMPKEFGFLTRSVFSKEANDLQLELSKINQMPNLKCVLATLCNFNNGDVECFNQLHCPSIFIGDSYYGPMEELDINRIILSPQGGVEAVKLLADQKYQEITMVVGNQSAYFYEKFSKGVLKAAEELDIKINVCELPVDMSKWDIEKIRLYFREFSAKSSILHDTPLILYGIKDEFLVEELLQIEKKKFPLPAILPRVDSQYLGGFYEQIYQMIREVVAEPRKIRKVDYIAPVLLRDLRTGKNYLHKEGEIHEL